VPRPEYLPPVPARSDLLRLAVGAAAQAADYLRSVDPPRDPAGWTVKGPNDFATDCDRRAEELIGEVLRAGEPGSRLLGEELSPTEGSSGLVWIADPLDGTTNFLHGFPCSSVSVAAAVDGVLEAAAVIQLEPDRRYTAVRGGGAWEDGRRIAVSRIGAAEHALIGTGFPFKRQDLLPLYQTQFARILRGASGIRRTGSAALDLAWVAAGRLDGFWELQLAPWDIAAGLLLVREAGGVATDLAGQQVGPAHTGLVAGNPAIHAWLLRQLELGSESAARSW
jgi:myo-inositol-1(or 4)-monophosphatase